MTTASPPHRFVCVHHVGRSQMALGFLNHLDRGGAVGFSTTRPAAPSTTCAVRDDIGRRVSELHSRLLLDDVTAGR